MPKNPDDGMSLWEALKHKITSSQGQDKPQEQERFADLLKEQEASADVSDVDVSVQKKKREVAFKPRTPRLSSLKRNKHVGVDKSLAKKLKRGDLPIEGKLDLHGMTQDEAFHALTHFITHSFKQGKRCVLVITGKGYRSDGGEGVLKSRLPHWLNDGDLRPKILSFCFARPKHGGEGAFYILLRKNKT